MSRRRASIKEVRGEVALFRRRALAGFVLILLGLAAVCVRYVYLQVLHHDEFVARSDQNRVKPRAIPPARGLIYDRNGVLLADNVPAFRLEVTPEQVPDMDAMLHELGAVVPISDEDITAFKKQVKQSRRFEGVPLKLKLTEDEIGRFAVNRWRFPGVDVVPYLTRRYPLAAQMAHVIGYVSRIDADDLDRMDEDEEASYKGTTHIGRIGIERYYEKLLHGQPGYELVEVNADGRTQAVLDTTPPTPGKNIYLSIDVRLQKAAEEAMNGRAGAAIAIDPRNGQVLAFASEPSFDPNLFVNGISSADYKALTTAPDKPLYNRGLRGVYPPGSTVKPFLALGGLAMGIRRPSDTVLSTGEFCIPGQSRCYRDDKRGGDGTVNLQRAIEKSTNTYFYRLALDMGIDRLADWMGRFGFGQKTGIDLVGEVEGILPSREWKATRSKAGWYPGETIIAGIGQGYWAVTPLQLAHATATFAGRGVPYKPHFLLDTQDGVDSPRVPQAFPPTGPSLIRKPADWDAVDQGMIAVINGEGTGKGLGKGFPYVIAGKSGTAERFSRTTNAYNENKNTAYLATRHRALFIAYTPAEDPRIAVAVVLEAGAWGAKDSGPIARKILDQWVVDEGGQRPTDLSPADVVTSDALPEAAPASEGTAPASAASAQASPDDDNVEDQGQ
ncbi:penicillin-binding protein 2 [Luteibacter sp. UNCMF366Tsu5.1]|uniref:penicillin-binding protein 2 n=1 Tax=Luteibacter sp. UNCMF366Tsu5.1 TaxID=1502758 RepID=UPI000908C370|nr:penicillin-binding protein 2 [Luteibacter sp. UNCMF366Tsu5.1]SFW44707.1 penicillin-binding protein 2 [Luteibacter sp. UNCMF366Tsu5.1]